MTDFGDDDFFDSVSTTFPSVEDLAPTDPKRFGPGRLVAIWAKSNGDGPSKQGGRYPFTETTILVLDDGPDGSVVTELVPAAPYRVDMRISAQHIHGKIKDRVTGRNAKGVPLRFRPMIGRVDTRPSAANKNVAAFGIVPATDADREIALKHKDAIVSINKEMEAAGEDAPF